MADEDTIQNKRLRRMLGDRIPPAGDENDAFFDNAEIQDLIDQYTDLNVAAFYGWLEKMAEFAKLIDRNLSGADMRLSGMFKNAEAMSRHYGQLAGIGDANSIIIGRMPGRAVSLRETCAVPAVMTGISGFRSEAHNPEMRTLMHHSEPETLEEPTYPEPGAVAT